MGAQMLWVFFIEVNIKFVVLLRDLDNNLCLMDLLRIEIEPSPRVKLVIERALYKP